MADDVPMRFTPKSTIVLKSFILRIPPDAFIGKGEELSNISFIADTVAPFDAESGCKNLSMILQKRYEH